MSSLLCAASALLVIGRRSLPLRMLLRPDNPSLLGAVLSQRSSVLTSLQRKRFLCRKRLRLLRCSGALSALLMRLSAVDGCSGHVIAQHKVIDRIMWRVFSGATLGLQEKVQLQLRERRLKSTARAQPCAAIYACFRRLQPPRASQARPTFGMRRMMATSPS